MAKRRRFSRWRRLPGAYRFGDEKPPDPDLELQRLTLYVTGRDFDRALAHAERLGFPTVQDYCTSLVLDAIASEHDRGRVAEVEARRGPLEGLHAIADDPEYLAELSAAASAPHPSADPGPLTVSVRLARTGPAREPAEAPADEPERQGLPSPLAEARAPALGAPALAVLRHAGQLGDDPYGFLPCLRRGEPVPSESVADLAQSLQQLEYEYRNARAMDRRLTFALHRLAYEGQVLLTDAWPGAFDAWTVDTLRAVQEAVERILSGQDIRYFSGPEAVEAAAPPPQSEEPR